jgi:hypothetical protein
LSWFLCLASNNDRTTVMTFSEHGNAHSSPYACHGDNNRQSVDDSIKINDLLVQGPHRFPNKIWYPNVHLKDLSIAASTFDKAIRITLDTTDLDTIVSIMAGKVRIDLHTETVNQKTFTNRHLLEQWLPMYQVEPFDNVLFVSFKDLMYNSMDDLVTKLSGFTNIPTENFNKQNLQLWRMKTTEGVKHINMYR